MIGPPNQGSKMARMLRWNPLFRLLTGTAGQQLGVCWDELKPKLLTPPFEFGIIAGGQRDGGLLSNFFLPGKDDFTVSVEETRLVGATDSLVRPLLHSSMMKHKTTLDATLNFLRHGYFISRELRTPLL